MNETETDGYIDYWDIHVPRYPPTITTTLLVVALIILITGIVGNLGVLLVVVRIPDMRTPMYLCLSSLSISDLLVLIFLPIIPLFQLLRGLETDLGVVVCYILSVFERSALFCSVLTVLVISVERYVVIYHPLRAARLITARRTTIALIIIWILSFVANAGFIDMTTYEQKIINGTTEENCGLYASRDWHDPYLTIVTCALFFLPLFVVIVLNFVIVKKVAMQPPSDAGDAEGTANIRRARRQAVIIIVLIVVFFVICIAPFHVLVLVQIYSIELFTQLTDDDFQFITWFGRLFMYINSAVNPIIYNVVSSKFRAAMLKSLTCSKTTPSSYGVSSSRVENMSRSTTVTM